MSKQTLKLLQKEVKTMEEQYNFVQRKVKEFSADVKNDLDCEILKNYQKQEIDLVNIITDLYKQINDIIY